MILNGPEFLLVNNPVRAWIQKHFEAPRLESMGGAIEGGYALEIGCGRGVGTEVILDRFRAARVDAIDLDPRMVRLAQQRLKGRSARIWAGDATHLETANSIYDAAFDFGIIHHIPEWRKAIREIWRVLKPGGRFYAEEALRDLINGRLSRSLFDHPREDRFDHQQFIAALGETGFQVVATKQAWNRFGWYFARKGAYAK